jgi:integrase
LFGLLAATGIRVGEALALDRADIDWEMGLLVIRRGKFGKARVVPIHNSTTGRLQRYEAERDRVHQTPRTPAFFVSESGGRLPYRTVSAMFRKVRESLHIRPPAGSRYPRLHDLRHRFAVTTLIRWYRNGEDVGRRSPVLSTYLGHTSPAHTYWYLSAVPELLCLATKRLESGGSRHEN